MIESITFDFGNTLASNIANKFQGAGYYHLEPSALFYCAAILLIFTLVVNVSAQVIVKRFELKQGR